MASGTGAYGGTGQCYRFWLGFTQCRASSGDPSLCLLERADYLECITRDKLKKRIMDKAVAIARKEQPTTAAGSEGHGHH